jgi:hypothetical protein
MMLIDTTTTDTANDNGVSMPAAPRAAKIIEIRDIPAKPYKRFGRIIERDAAVGQHATIVPGKSITLHGVYGNRVGGPVTYSRTFILGDTASYGGYNMTYMGTITSITAKTVTIVEDHGGRVHRLELHEFNWRNWDFDADAAWKRNCEWCD